jgi:cytochrome b
MSAPRGVRIWDLPTRLFHWGLVILIGLAWWSISTRQVSLHRTVGALTAGLVVFRLWWGLFGGSTARFSDFLRGPGTVLAYARSLVSKASGPKGLSAGHNPMGGWSVVLLIVLTGTIVGLGLFAVDTDGLESGPLASLVDYDAGRLASHWHGLAFDLLKGLVVLHLGAIAFYALFKRENLVRAMIDGKKPLEEAGAGLQPARIWALAVGLVLGGGVAWLLIRMAG